MPRLTGIFDKFQGLEAISVSDIARWLNFKIEPHYIENFIANRTIYPHTVPATPQEMQIDLAIFTEAVKRNEKTVFNRLKSTITLTSDIAMRFPLNSLALAISNAINLPEKTTVLMKDWAGSRPLGTIINMRESTDQQLTLVLDSGKGEIKTYKFKKGSLGNIPCLSRQGILKINSSRPIQVAGGELGIVLDLREVGKN